MSQLYLAAGSEEPPRIEGKIRLYSLEYCPYVHRVRLVLKAKNIPHDVVNINLINKPQWYYKIHPEGKVPSLYTGSEVIIESLDIADYLDEKYPSTPLYPKDPELKKRDKDLIKKIHPVTEVFLKSIWGKVQQSREEWARDFKDVWEVFNSELGVRGSRFFGGDKPGMVDYMLWPWVERKEVVAKAVGQKLQYGPEELKNMREWYKAMMKDPACEATYYETEKHWKAVQIMLRKLPPDYDNM